MLTLTTQKTKTAWERKLSFRNFRLCDTFDSYSKMVDWVTEYCVAVRNLPEVTLENPADWYNSEFIRKYASCKAHASLWTDNGILMQLIAIPDEIINYDTMYQLQSQLIVSYAQTIIENPQSKIAEEAKLQLKRSLNRLRGNVQRYQDEIKNVEKSLVQFKKDVDVYKAFFEKLYKDSRTTKKADDKLLGEYRTRINTLQVDLKKWSDVQKGMLIAMGVQVVAIPVALACGPFGILVGVILGIGMIATGIMAIVADEKIKEDSFQLKILTELFDSYTRDAAVLQILIDRMEVLSQTLGQVEASLVEINRAWKQLNGNIGQVIDALEKAGKEEEKELYEGLIKLLGEADEEWEKVVKKAKDVRLNAARPELNQVYPAAVA